MALQDHQLRESVSETKHKSEALPAAALKMEKAALPYQAGLSHSPALTYYVHMRRRELVEHMFPKEAHLNLSTSMLARKIQVSVRRLRLPVLAAMCWWP